MLRKGVQPGVALGALGGLAVVIGCLTTWANVALLGGSGFGHSYPGTHFGEGQVTLALGAAATFLALASMVERRLLIALPVLGGAALALTLSKRSEITDAFSVSFRGFHLVSASAGGGLDLAIAGSALLVIAAAAGLLSRNQADEPSVAFLGRPVSGCFAGENRRLPSGSHRRAGGPLSFRSWRRYGWFALAASCACYLLLSLALHRAVYPWGRPDYFDLRVYRGAAQLVLNDRSLYHARIWQWAPFTYPPIAAIAFTPLALLPLVGDEFLVAILNVVMLFAVLALALRLPCGRCSQAGPTQLWRSALVPAAAAAALWLEPVTATLGYGQINLLIALLIVADLSRDETAGSKGTLIGLAAGLKLTPLIFVPYLFFSRRRRAAFVALATFAATVAVGYALLPSDAHTFWGGVVLDARRVGGCCLPANQSLRGAILQLFPSAGSVWLLGVALLVAIVGVAVAILASRRGDEAMGFSRCATTGLLVSPVSWTHHWTLAVPALLLLGVRAVCQRSRFGMIAVAGILVVGYSYLPKLMSKPGLYPRSGSPLGWTLASAIYVLIGLVALTVACTNEIRNR